MIETPEQPQTASPVAAPGTIDGDGGVVRAAAVLAAGNVASRSLGMGREMVKANLFGASGLLSAYEIAAYVPITLFDLIIGGMVNSSLVPVFSEYLAQDRREQLWRAVSTFLSIATVVLILVVGLVEVFAAPIAGLLGAYNLDGDLPDVAVRLTRLATPAVLFLSISSILTGVLYALKRFTLPAFTAAVFNATIVVVALLRPQYIDSLIYGLLLGSILQIVIQAPALRDARLRWNLNWQHPVIRRILRLYAPIVAGLAINQAGIAVGIHLATLTGDASLTYMRYATTLYQFPLGLVVTALSIATLPTLSQQAGGTVTRFKQTLAEGLRLVLVLILPATAGLFALAAPIVSLLFEHGQFTAFDTDITATVLRVFLIGLPFAAVDQMLVFASYARKDTLRPALVGVVSIIIYVAFAAALLRPLGLLSLMVADAAKHITHTLLMLLVLNRQIGGLAGLGIPTVAAKSVLAALITGIAAFFAAAATTEVIGGATLVQQFATVAIAGAVGLGAYLVMVFLLDIAEAKSLRHILRRSS